MYIYIYIYITPHATHVLLIRGTMHTTHTELLAVLTSGCRKYGVLTLWRTYTLIIVYTMLTLQVLHIPKNTVNPEKAIDYYEYSIYRMSNVHYVMCAVIRHRVC